MKLVTIDCVPGGQPGVALSSGEILHLARAALPGTMEAWLPTTMRGILEAGEEGLDIVRRMAGRAEEANADHAAAMRASGALLPAVTRLLAPVPNPVMILSIGQAYHSHVHEMKGKPPAEPHAFLKAPSAITSPGADITLPPQSPDKVDFEGELCAVIGRACHNVSAEEAMAYVAGYTVTNDVSARDSVHLLGKATTTPEARSAWDLVHMDKQFPGFSPMGPALVTADEIADPGMLDLTTRVNGEVMQHANTSQMIFSVQKIIEYVTEWTPLKPGDLIVSGTMGGVGFARTPPIFMKPGDIAEVGVVDRTVEVKLDALADALKEEL